MSARIAHKARRPGEGGREKAAARHGRARELAIVDGKPSDGFPFLPAMVRGRQSRPATHAMGDVHLRPGAVALLSFKVPRAPVHDGLDRRLASSARRRSEERLPIAPEKSLPSPAPAPRSPRCRGNPRRMAGLNLLKKRLVPYRSVQRSGSGS